MKHLDQTSCGANQIPDNFRVIGSDKPVQGMGLILMILAVARGPNLETWGMGRDEQKNGSPLYPQFQLDVATQITAMKCGSEEEEEVTVGQGDTKKRRGVKSQKTCEMGKIPTYSRCLLYTRLLGWVMFRIPSLSHKLRRFCPSEEEI